VIVLDEHLQELGIERSIARWYRGKVCTITDLRPGTGVKDDAIPRLLRTAVQPTFVTLNWTDFWERTVPNQGFCIVCLTLPPKRVAEVSSVLRRLFRLSSFNTKAARMGKVVRVSGEQATYYQAHDVQRYTLSFP
jgi:hypothetical protein